MSKVGYKSAFDEWIEKTEWVQKTVQPHELGYHRADILRMRIEAIEAEVSHLYRCLAE